MCWVVSCRREARKGPRASAPELCVSPQDPHSRENQAIGEPS